jgi:hypothetical protein
MTKAIPIWIPRSRRRPRCAATPCCPTAAARRRWSTARTATGASCSSSLPRSRSSLSSSSSCHAHPLAPWAAPVRAVEAQRSWVEGVPLQRGGAVGEHEQAVRRDCGHAVEGEVRAREAVEGERRRLVQRGHEVVKRDEEEEACTQHGLIRFTAPSRNKD